MVLNYRNLYIQYKITQGVSMEYLETLYLQIQNNIVYDLVYDITKIIIGYIFAKIIYDKVIMKLKWGGREVIVKNDQKVLVNRTLSPEVARRIETDATDFSVYIKGVVSPFAWLTVDVSSDKAESLGLVCRDGKRVTIDISKNRKEARKMDSSKDTDIIIKLDTILERLSLNAKNTE